MYRQNNNQEASSSVSINIGNILNNVLIQPLTQTKMSSNLNFSKAPAPTSGREQRDPRDQYYYEEEYDDEVIDLEGRSNADPPIRKVRADQDDDDEEQFEDDNDFNNKWVIPSK